MDAGTPPVAPTRHVFLRRHGAIVAILLVVGGACRLGGSDDIGWLAQRDWHLAYDTLGALLLWLGALGVLPHLTYSLWANYGPGRHTVARRRVGVVLGAAVALVVLAMAPSPLSISKQHQVDTNTYRYDTEHGAMDVEDTRQDSYAFLGFRQLPQPRLAENTGTPAEPNTRTLWSGPHSSWRGTQETYRWHAAMVDNAATFDSVYEDIQPQGYECLEARMSYVGPFQAQHRWERIEPYADPARQSVCRRAMRFRGGIVSPEEAMRAYKASAGDSPLAHAVADALPRMADTLIRNSEAELELTRWMAKHPLSWESLQNLPKASARQDMKDISQERGKLACSSGRLQQSGVNVIDDITAHSGVLIDEPSGAAYSFTTARPMGKLAEGDHARFCGVVIGMTAAGDPDGRALDTVALAGMFDLPENHQ